MKLFDVMKEMAVPVLKAKAAEARAAADEDVLTEDTRKMQGYIKAADGLGCTAPHVKQMFTLLMTRIERLQAQVEGRDLPKEQTMEPDSIQQTFNQKGLVVFIKTDPHSSGIPVNQLYMNRGGDQVIDVKGIRYSHHGWADHYRTIWNLSNPEKCKYRNSQEIASDEQIEEFVRELVPTDFSFDLLKTVLGVDSLWEIELSEEPEAEEIAA